MLPTKMTATTITFVVADVAVKVAVKFDDGNG